MRTIDYQSAVAGPKGSDRGQCMSALPDRFCETKPTLQLRISDCGLRIETRRRAQPRAMRLYKQSQMGQPRPSVVSSQGHQKKRIAASLRTGWIVRNKAKLERDGVCRKSEGRARGGSATAWTVRNKADGGGRVRLQCARTGIQRNASRRHYEQVWLRQTKPIRGRPEANLCSGREL